MCAHDQTSPEKAWDAAEVAGWRARQIEHAATTGGSAGRLPYSLISQSQHGYAERMAHRLQEMGQPDYATDF